MLDPFSGASCFHRVDLMKLEFKRLTEIQWHSGFQCLTRETISPIRIQSRWARQEVSVFGFEGGIVDKLDRERGISVPRTGSVAGVQERVEKGNILEDMRVVSSSHCIVDPPDCSLRQYQNFSLSNMDLGKGLQGAASESVGRLNSVSLA